MKSEYERQFSSVDPKMCELIYEANRHFRTMRRKHEYEHTPLGGSNFEELIAYVDDETFSDVPLTKRIVRRSSSIERLSTNVPHTRKFSRRSKSADRSLLSHKPYYEKKGPVEEARIMRSSVESEGSSKGKSSSGRPKVRIKLPPFMAYGSGCSGREIGDLKTYNVNAASQVDKNALRASYINGITKSNSRSRMSDEDSGPSISPTDIDKCHYELVTGTWLSKNLHPDWKTEYSSNYCS